MKYWKIINNNTHEEMYVTAINMDRIALYILKNLTPDWYYGCNIVEVNADKTRKDGNFMCVAVREYFVETYGTEDDAKILNSVYESYLAKYKKQMA